MAVAEEFRQIGPTPELAPSYQYFDSRIDTAFDIQPGEVIPPLRIAIMGSDNFGIETIKQLREQGHEIVAIYGPPKLKGDTNFDKIRNYADEEGIKQGNIRDLRKEDGYVDFRDNVKPDLIIGANNTEIVDPRVCEVAELGAYGWHPSDLTTSHYRGSAAIQWQILNGVENIGMSMHAYGREDDLLEPDESHQDTSPLPKGSKIDPDKDKADWGPVLAMKLVPRGDARSTSRFYQEKLMAEGPKFIVENVNKIAVAKAKGEIYRGQKQVRGAGSYQPPIDKDDVAINWSDTATEIEDMVNAGEFGLGAYTLLENGKPVSLFGARAMEGTATQPARIKELDDTSAIIETGKGLLLVNSMRGGEIVREENARGETIVTWNKEKSKPLTEFADEYELKAGVAFKVDSRVTNAA